MKVLLAILALVTLALLDLACVGAGSQPAAQTAPATSSATAAPAPALAIGQPILARFRSGPYWFAGRVSAIGAATVAVAYLDGTHEELPSADVRPFDWGVGSRVECNWRNKGGYYAGQIIATDGQNGANIAYEDGTREPIDIALCRSR